MTQTATHTEGSVVKPFILDDHRIMVGDLVVDLPLRTISSRSQKFVNLTGNEFAILATMIKFVGGFAPRRELVCAVAGRDFAGDYAIVDVYISYLNRRLIEADSSVTIEKRSGLGFRIVP